MSTVVVKLQLPPSLTGPTPDFEATVRKHLQPVVEDAIESIKGRTRYEKISEGYRPVHEGGFTAVSEGLENPVPEALWREIDTDPHDIPGAFGREAPFGTGGRYDGKFHPGTKGDHIVEQEMEAARPKAEAALQRAAAEILGSGGTI